MPSRGHRKNIFNESMKFMGGSILKDPFNSGGFKSTLDFCSIDVQKEAKTESTPSNSSKSYGPEVLTNQTKPVRKNQNKSSNEPQIPE